MREENIYDYVIESLNNILQNGIDYYDSKNENLQSKLIEIKEYINNQKKEYDKEKNKQIEKSNEVKDYENPSDIDLMLKDYLNTISNIKISILNLENDNCLYFDETKIDCDKSDDNEVSVNNNSNGEQENVYESNYLSIEQNSELVEEQSTEIDLNINNDEIENTNVVQEDNKSIENNNNAPSRKSIFDLFRKN